MLKALAEPNRRRILELVREQELSAGEIAGHFAISAPAVSQHIAVLREAGLVHQRREGSFRYYKARPEAMGDLRSFLDAFWRTSLEQLKERVEWEEQEKKTQRIRH